MNGGRFQCKVLAEMILISKSEASQPKEFLKRKSVGLEQKKSISNASTLSLLVSSISCHKTTSCYKMYYLFLGLPQHKSLKHLNFLTWAYVLWRKTKSLLQLVNKTWISRTDEQIAIFGKWALSVELLLVLFSCVLEMHIVFPVAYSNLPVL